MKVRLALPVFMLLGTYIHVAFLMGNDEKKNEPPGDDLACELVPEEQLVPCTSAKNGLRTRVLLDYLVYTRAYMTITFVMLYCIVAWNIVMQLLPLHLVRFDVFAFLDTIEHYCIAFIAGLFVVGVVAVSLDDGGLVSMQEQRRVALVTGIIVSTTFALAFFDL